MTRSQISTAIALAKTGRAILHPDWNPDKPSFYWQVHCYSTKLGSTAESRNFVVNVTTATESAWAAKEAVFRTIGCSIKKVELAAF